MKSLFGTFLSLLLGAVAGYLLFSVLGLATGLDYGRNPLPVAICAGVVLVGFGFAYGRWLHRSVLGSVLGAAAYVAIVYVVVAKLGGTVGGIYMRWFLAALAVTVLPWSVGAVVGRLTRRR
jgi:hypothetical protein